MELSEREYEALLGIVAAASHGTPEQPLPTPVLEAIRQLFPNADTLAYFEGPPRARPGTRVWIAGPYLAWTDAERRLLARLRYQDPLFPRAETLGRAWRRTDLIPIDAWRKTDLYRLLDRRHGIEYSMDYWMRSSDGVLRGLSLDSSRRDFSEGDRLALDLLGRHLETVLGRHPAQPSADASSRGVTARQAEILYWAARGRTNSEIAGLLSVSAHTVRKHLENAFTRLGVHTRAAAVARVYESGVLRVATGPRAVRGERRGRVG